MGHSERSEGGEGGMPKGRLLETLETILFTVEFMC